ncbi:MAG: preprotein translocase subunit SecA [Proteobacteria bacterium]|nr:preprotein translocase subunit SecA [Pseudomonadota bacterium]
MFSFVTRKLFGSQNERELKKIFPVVTQVNDLEKSYLPLSNEDLKNKTFALKEAIEKGQTLDEVLPDAFALVREASKRIMGMRHFDVQLIGGMVLHQGRISEMRTGEGKTLTATLPAFLNALSGKGVHVVTVNDYLAKRDAEWMGRLYNFLGLSCGVVTTNISNTDRKSAYLCDITYGQNNEFGFDYLRDNMKLELSEKVQREHNFAIVDEVDSILIDESRTPLIISGPSEDSSEAYQVADQVVRQLKETTDYTIELKNKNVMFTDEGVEKIEKILKLENLYEPGNIQVVHHMTQALKAHVTMQRDFDYVVRDNQVIIVDEFTGRLMPGRRWSDGLHQAVEAKEAVKVQRENQTLATITFQNYFRMYKKLSGMTGTADTEAVEFKKIYNLDVVVIPTNMSMVRQDYNDVVYATEKGKFKAVCDEIEELKEKGQPILVGTASIARSELISGMLHKRGIAHHVLNAKQHEREAEIIAQAGRFGMVTISTNMAGRGTDILLGGNPEFLASAAADTKDPEDPEFQEQLKYFKAECAKEKEKVVAAGGLHILGTERHESRRIDNQLRGRAGRQGDPGSSRFYISLEDDLMKRFGGDRIQQIMSKVGLTDDDAIAGVLVGRAIENAQKKVEGHHFDIRKHLLEYDDVMNKQRQVIYTERERILKGENMEEKVLEAIPDIIEQIIVARANEKTPPHQWEVEGMFSEIKRIFGLHINAEQFLKKQESAGKEFAQELYEFFLEQVKIRYEERAKNFGHERMRKLERMVYLQGMDHFWKEHLSNMDHLKEGIGLRGYGQKNPLHEYQKEAFDMFGQMMLTTKTAVLQNIFIPELPSETEIEEIERKEIELQRKREEQAKTIHENVLDQEVEENDDSPEGLNRKQRRQMKQNKKSK